MWTYNNSYELYHHGILGQKWGVRRYQNEDGSLTPAGEKRYIKNTKKLEKQRVKDAKKLEKQRIKDAKKEAKDANKHRHTMSDEELLERIGRLEKEKKLRELTESEIAPGAKAAKDILGQSGKKVAVALVAGGTLYAIKAALSRKFNLEEFAGYVAPKPKNK